MIVDDSVFTLGELIVEAKYPNVLADVILSYLIDLQFSIVLDEITDKHNIYLEILGIDPTPKEMMMTVNIEKNENLL